MRSISNEASSQGTLQPVFPLVLVQTGLPKLATFDRKRGYGNSVEGPLPYLTALFNQSFYPLFSNLFGLKMETSFWLK